MTQIDQNFSKNIMDYVTKYSRKNIWHATLNISNCAIDTVLKKKNEYGFLSPEKRGTHSSGTNKIGDALVKGVVDHINSFPRTESYYCRSTTKREYLEGSLNVSIMYRLYREKCSENERPFVKQYFYQEIFNTKFNLGFFKPKCEIYQNLSEDEKVERKKTSQNINKKRHWQDWKRTMTKRQL
jgi:hypothetical protein